MHDARCTVSMEMEERMNSRQKSLLMAIAGTSGYLQLTKRQTTWLVYSSLTFAWLFTLPAIANAWFGTRRLAFGGGPFGDSLANNVIYLLGWPPIMAVHIAFALLLIGAWKYYRAQGSV